MFVNSLRQFTGPSVHAACVARTEVVIDAVDTQCVFLAAKDTAEFWAIAGCLHRRFVSSSSGGHSFGKYYGKSLYFIQFIIIYSIQF